MEETKRPQFTIDLCGFQLHSIFLYQCENVLSIIADFQSHILFHLPLNRSNMERYYYDINS